MTITTKWHLVQSTLDYIDFDKEVLSCGDEGDTSLDVRLTFNLPNHYAWMTVAWHNDDGNTFDLDGTRPIEWDAAIRLLEADDADIPVDLL